MKTYNAPQAQVVNFDNDYVMTTTYPSPSGSASSAVVSPGLDDSGPSIVNDN